MVNDVVSTGTLRVHSLNNVLSQPRNLKTRCVFRRADLRYCRLKLNKPAENRRKSPRMDSETCGATSPLAFKNDRPPFGKSKIGGASLADLVSPGTLN